MNETEFIKFLAKQMNTPSEQLEMTYASCDTDGFEDFANAVMKLTSDEKEDGLDQESTATYLGDTGQDFLAARHM